MPFHAAVANMAALLRSARLLKISPSGLLHITATSRNGPPLGRLYSGALGGSRTGGCARLSSPASENASSSCVWPHAVGCVRGYALASDTKNTVSVELQSKQTHQFDWALAKLDHSVRRTGRITKTLLLSVFHDICSTGYHNGNQALLLLRSCGSLLPEVPLEERTVLVHSMWEKLQELGVQLDVSHYNALLKVYLQNEFKFSPTDFLTKMEAAKVYPNRVTYQRLIEAYCQNGDIEGASTILGFMKTKGLPITEAVFNSLVTGHGRADDIESAKSILSVMQGAGIEPGPDTYLSLLTIFAEKGDLDSLEKTNEEAESADCSLMDRDIMQVIFTLARAGHQQHIPNMVERLRHEKRFLPDFMNLCLSLITQGEEDTAFDILKSFPTLEPNSYNTDSPNIGNFFLRHCVNMNTAVAKIRRYCKELQESNRHRDPLTFSLNCSLEAKNFDMSLELMKILKEQGLPVKSHYFCPLLSQNVKDKNSAGVLEVVKGMQELSVSPDVDTFSKFILPAFPSTEAARQALMNAGIPVDSEAFLSVEVHSLAVSDLGKLYNLLSDPSFPPLEHNIIRHSLILGFRKSDDVESMAKITKLLFQDKRFSVSGSMPAERASYFLYYLFDNMTKMDVQAEEHKLRKYLNRLHSQKITIPEGICKGITNQLQSYNVPKLIEDVTALMSQGYGASSDSLSPDVRVAGTEAKVARLLKKLAKLKAEDKPIGTVLNNIIHALCVEENLQHALELKQQHKEEIIVTNYTSLIYLCCRQGNVEEALNLKREMSCKDSSSILDSNKYIALVRALSNNGRVEEAVDILKEMKEKEVVLTDTHTNLLFHTLNSLVGKGGVPIIRRLQDTIFALGLTKPSANLCSPLITAYLESKDLSGALEAVIDIQKRYNHMPQIHNILVGLVENGETELLQKAIGVVSQERGEMNMFYGLFFAFLQTGRIREARKIIETQGLRARPARIQWFAEKCIYANQMETLQQMVDMTAQLFDCDRDEMYSYILRLCKETNNLEKAEEVWTKMQEENIIPRERTRRMLADIMKNNGHEVPFEVPETWYDQAATTKSAVTPITAESNTEYQANLSSLCKKGKAKEAYKVLKEAEETGLTLTASLYDLTICALLAQGDFKDAMAVKDIALSRVPDFQLTNNANNLLIIAHIKKGRANNALETLKFMMQMGHIPSHPAIMKLVNALGGDGNIAGIQEVESLMKGLDTTLNISRIFVNNKALAHIKNDDMESAVELLESVYTSPDTQHNSISFVFAKVIEDGNDKALDTLSAMAERLANHFACYRPATDLFLQLLDMDKYEEAKFMLARCNALAEQNDTLRSFMSRKAKTPGQVGKLKALLSLIPDFTNKQLSSFYLMKCHYLDNDLVSAKALHEQMQKEGMVMDNVSLKRLAVLYRNAGETAPFPEPSKSFKFYTDQLKGTVTVV
ncbi:leucine-rich PPR motif-containing protein, mitochondrial [Scophthalmus maximus]|uniref:Leucine rich pentatricopeptide repeat containing n=1 Tax=Scophthalmus maximus TaxID=52904 RepID=A0A8D3CHV6_SCOMX|nr:leucine-rich PPR motif-containing protein, mitochondrial [Scophthalmus maximus]